MIALPRYPIYVPSYDRAAKCLTASFLDRDEVPFRVVVKAEHFDAYAKTIGKERLLVLPGEVKGLWMTRNWIRMHAEQEGHGRHWQLDDNIRVIRRYVGTQRLPANGGVALRAVEDFTDRFENVGIAGLNYNMFVSGKELRRNPIVLNVHVYSCTLINHQMPYWWRMPYNDDTDLCLQALTAGWCTLLVDTYVAEKVATMKLRGGNTDQLYLGQGQGHGKGSGRFKMARDLVQRWQHVTFTDRFGARRPIVTMDRRWGRPQHVVNWSAFDTLPRRRPDVPVPPPYYRPDGLLGAFAVKPPQPEEYGVTLLQLDPAAAQAHPELAELIEYWKALEVGDA